MTAGLRVRFIRQVYWMHQAEAQPREAPMPVREGTAGVLVPYRYGREHAVAVQVGDLLLPMVCHRMGDPMPDFLEAA